MKEKILLGCMLSLLLFSTPSHAQDVQQKKVSVSFKNEPVVRCLNILQQRNGVTFFYNPADLKAVEKKVTADISNKSIADVLHLLLENTGLEYEVVDGKKVVIRKAIPRQSTPRTPQKRTLNGVVTDAAKHTPIGKAEVMIQSTGTVVTADETGHFSAEVKDTTDVLVVYFAGYTTKTLRAGAASVMTISLAADNKTLSGVTVEARRRANTEVMMLNDRKNAAVISDGISAQQMERTASVTTTQALQRVSGVTITDDKYIAIRGLGDRSVIGQLNGVRLASSDPDRSALPLDLVPASLLDNITIYKSITPDKPADAAAGIVELKTKSVPEHELFSITVQSGKNSQTGNGVNSFYNSDMGFLGDKVKNKQLSEDFKNLSNQYPGGLKEIQQLITDSRNSPAKAAEANRINNIMHSFDPVLTTRYKSAPLNQIYSITYGNSYTVFKKHQLGLIAGANYYNRTNDIYDGTLTQYSVYQGVLTGNSGLYSPRVIPNYITPNKLNLGKYLNYKENTGTQTLNYGFLGGLTYRFNPQHEISMQYLGSKGAETKASNLHGQYEYTGLPGKVYNNVYSLRQTYRVLNTFNLQGEHKFGKTEYAPKLSYNLATSKSTQDDPDYRFVNLADYRLNEGTAYAVPSNLQNGIPNYVYTQDLYALVSGYVNGYGPYGIIQADPNGRRYRKLTEDNYNYKADVTLPFKVLGLHQDFKTGVNYLHRRRTFGENILYLPGSNYSTNGALALYEVNGNLDQLVGYNRIGIRPPSSSNEEGAPKNGGFLYNTQKSPNNYKGYYETRAFYGMLDLHLTEQLRVTGGVRFEMTDIQAVVDTANVFLDPNITTTDASGNKVNLVYTEPNSAYKTDYKPYYSANVTYTLNKSMNFRLGYNTTLARPELRELTNVFDFDPFQFALVVGNPKLKNQQTTNYDFRWEWFVKPGEVLSASVFYKEIDNQLTKVFKQQSSGLEAKFPEFPAIEFQNDPNKGRVYGIELEAVKNLGMFAQPLRFFNLGANLLLAQSEIKKTKERLEASRSIDRRAPANSPLFEQAPYSMNIFLNFNQPVWKTDITATFNMVGERLIQVNLDGTPDLYSRPLPVLDLVFTQQLFKRLQLKGFAKNLLDRPVEEVYANPGTGGMFYGKKYVRRSFYRGTEYMLGLTYTLSN
ncbi:TonB-dependent receptor domain-containing protein [Chitinophaga sp. Cy-1792]|uniref:TonB-dependent receptor domain-containing protein n=1 Tax=Chitinophaga sp. Cy-1792 TaxID=2608339 RepID=UPI0014221ABA|nr:TonB-dependent receptor [Chitinophaga sp. Cy-1792]NIG56735.1 TonB-dependent receptor plug domain-containing protein [Chitinophaga sp. Cy-1792]